MAITLAVAISGANDNPIVLSADPSNARAVKIDNEQMLVLEHRSGITRNQRAVDGSGQGSDPAVQVAVQRGYNGTDPGPHAAGATVTPLYEAMTATAGTLV
jgi:hypothetical protein